MRDDTRLSLADAIHIIRFRIRAPGRDFFICRSFFGKRPRHAAITQTRVIAACAASTRRRTVVTGAGNSTCGQFNKLKKT